MVYLSCESPILILCTSEHGTLKTNFLTQPDRKECIAELAFLEISYRTSVCYPLSKSFKVSRTLTHEIFFIVKNFTGSRRDRT